MGFLLITIYLKKPYAIYIYRICDSLNFILKDIKHRQENCIANKKLGQDVTYLIWWNVATVNRLNTQLDYVLFRSQGSTILVGNKVFFLLFILYNI